MMKRWAEWFTVIITGSLIPIEVYAISRDPTPIKVLLLIINIAVVPRWGTSSSGSPHRR